MSWVFHGASCPRKASRPAKRHQNQNPFIAIVCEHSSQTKLTSVIKACTKLKKICLKKSNKILKGRKYIQQQHQHHYALISVGMKWMEAREHCRTHYTDLASVRNATESQMIKTVSGGLEVWVGLFRDPWVWSGNTFSSFRNWIESREVYTNQDAACNVKISSHKSRSSLKIVILIICHIGHC
uniref:C-type lectin domain-containing protein n=1 Tax=Periophthalmus magnuspinnatus TaxID=409849 RepID=A0A3B4AVX6_9GOBI